MPARIDPKATGNVVAVPMPRPTAQVEPYVEALGSDLAVRFILQFGGAEVYIAADPKGRSSYEVLVGPDGARALAAVADRLQARVPIANRWLAAMLAWQGYSTAHIARTIRVSDPTVRRWLKDKVG